MIMNINMVTNVLEQEEQQTKEIDIYQELECDYCNKKITKNEGLFIKQKDSYKVFYFDNGRCKFAFKKKLKTKQKKEIQKQQRLKKCESTNCNKVFDTKSVKERRYCSKQCAYENHPRYYDLYYWCEMCNEWILQADSILLPKGSTKTYGRFRSYTTRNDKHLCPQCKNKLRTRSGYQTRHKDKKKKEEKENNNSSTSKKVVLTI